MKNLVPYLLLICAPIQAFELPKIDSLFIKLQPKEYYLTTSHQPKFVWFSVPHAGNEVISSIIHENNIPLVLDNFKIDFEPKEYKDYLKFAFVRNPWDRVVYCYHHFVVTETHPKFKECFGKDFATFVNFIHKQDVTNSDPLITLQTELLPIKHIDVIGRMETFNDSLNQIFNKFGIQVDTPDIIPEYGHYSHFYNEKTRKIIEKKYKKDIEILGYLFEFDDE